jgi:hypothetical protein
MRAFHVLGELVGLALLTVRSSCESSGTSTPSTPSSADDASIVDAGAPAEGAAAGPRDCTLADADRDDAGRPRMTVDRTKIGEICWTADAGDVAGCAANESCGLYQLPEDPPGTARCGLGCGAVTCPGEFYCTTGFSRIAGPVCTCP